MKPSFITAENKKIALITVDSLPYGDYATAIGVRTSHLIDYLKDYEITLFMPEKCVVDNTLPINVTLKTYKYDDAFFVFSNELHKELCEFDTVISPILSGACFHNLIRLPEHVELIIDGFENQLISLMFIMNMSNNYDDTYLWKYTDLYSMIIDRANKILVMNKEMQIFYEGQLFLKNKISYKQMCNNIYIVPYKFKKTSMVDAKPKQPEKFIWLGTSYPWYDLERTIEIFKWFSHWQLDIYNINHPHFANLYDKKLLDHLPDNINIIDKHLTDDIKLEVYDQYDAGFLLAKDSLEDKYTTRFRLFDLINYMLPVVTNDTNPIFYNNYGKTEDFCIKGLKILFPSFPKLN